MTAARRVPVRTQALAGRVLADHASTDPVLVGHKFARQAALLDAGFPIPGFFCVPATVFDDVLATVGGHTDPEIAVGAEHARDRMADVPVPADLAAELLARFDDLVGPHGLVAVRACIVARGDEDGEDSATDPFAGLSDSFLYVDRDHLLRRVAACWASAFNPRTVRYRMLRGRHPWSASVAVGVQRMVIAARSFVAFTRNPLSGADECVIAAAYGVGEGVVQEKADVDHFSVAPATAAVRSVLVHKTRMVGLDPADPGRGAVPRSVPTALADAPVLTDAEAGCVAALAARVEAYFGGAQDIEGAITDDGTIMLVQARPIVSATLEPPRSSSGGSLIHWANSNIVESFPGVCGMLTYSVAVEMCELIFTDCYRRLGVAAPTLRRNRFELRRMLGHLNGRLYYRLDTWYRLHAQLPDFESLRGTWERALGLRGGPGTTPRAARGQRGSWPYLLAQAAPLLRGVVRSRLAVRAYLRWWDTRYAEALARRQPDAGALVEEYQQLWAEIGERGGMPSVNNYYLFKALRLTNALVERWVPGAERGVLNGMLCGGRENRSAAALRSAIDLAERIRAVPALRAAVRDGDEQEVWARIVAGEFGASFATAALQHVQCYGDRGPQDLKLETVTIRTTPWILLRVLRAYAAQPLTVAESRRQEQQVEQRARQELRRYCGSPFRRTVLRTLFTSLREYARRREDARFCRSQIVGVSRDILRAIGADLAGSGFLDRSEDIIDLTVAEVLGLYQGTVVTGEVKRLVELRRAEREDWQRAPDPPVRLTTDSAVPLPRALREVGQRDQDAQQDAARAGVPQLCLTGIGSCSGRVRGPAKVVLAPHLDAEQVQGHILIARETDPGWLFLMIGSKGMVVEHGSPLSHTAITGRILSIPTVVAVEGATTRIRDGDWVELDGGAGTVTLVEPPDPSS